MVQTMVKNMARNMNMPTSDEPVEVAIRRTIRRLVVALDGSMLERHQKLADQLGVSMRTIYRWLRGETMPNQDQRRRLSELSEQSVESRHER